MYESIRFLDFQHSSWIFHRRLLWKKMVLWNSLQHSSLESLLCSVMERTFNPTDSSDTNQRTAKSETCIPKPVEHESSPSGSQ